MRATTRNRKDSSTRLAFTLAFVASSLLIDAKSFPIQPVLVADDSIAVPAIASSNKHLHAETTFSTLEPAYVKPVHSQGRQLSSSYRLSLTPAAAAVAAIDRPNQSLSISSMIRRPKNTGRNKSPPDGDSRTATRTATTTSSSSSSSSSTGMEHFDLAICAIYVCSIVALSIPTLLIPIIAADPASYTTSAVLSGQQTVHVAQSAAFVSKVVGLATLGGACGKFVNGFVCSSIGGKASARLYLVGLSIFSLLLSLCRSSFHGIALGGMEFFASVNWTACTYMIASAYEGSPERFTRGITALSLGSTLGSLFAKVAGSILLQVLHWRHMAQIGAVVALCGAGIVHVFIKDHDLMKETDRLKTSIRRRAGGLNGKQPSPASQQKEGIISSLTQVTSSPMFWMVGIAHAMGFLARRSDTFLGSFLLSQGHLPAHICGGLTASVTLGFIHGLKSSKHFNNLEIEKDKMRFVKNGYNISAAAALGLALCANAAVSSFLGKALTTAACIVSSFCMSSAISFQFYQLPAKCATFFANSKAICVSFLDGLAFLISAPIWYFLGQIIAQYGWSAAWSIIACFLAMGGKVMARALPDLMEFEGNRS